ncbi:MAG: hypothetical protein CMJ59_22715 [Planctomycetaceae bacterium]|nr:hypothetical protein [Planctomycetaceae bacterium]
MMNASRTRIPVLSSPGAQVVLWALALNVVGVSVARARVLFLVHADGPTANADYARGNGVARPVPANDYKLAGTAEAGRWGRAVNLTNGDANCIYDALQNISAHRGTVDFWFRIEEHKEGMYHPLFGWYRPPNQPGNRKRLSSMEVYFQNSVLTLGLHTPTSKGYSEAAPMKIDTWHHLEINWDCSRGDGQSVYNVSLDGKNVIHVENGGALSGEGGELHLGIWDYGWGHFLHGRIDELRITDQIEHPREFAPPTQPYALPGTIQYARDTHRVVRTRLQQLRSEIASLLEFSGAEGDAAAARIIRAGQMTARNVERLLASLQPALKADDPDLKSLCSAVDDVSSEVNVARLAIHKISAAAATIAALEDKRSHLFKDINSELAGDAILLNGKQLFVDDYIIETIKGAQKVLNQPVKHPRNPLIVADKPWEQTLLNRGSVIYDEQAKRFKMWYCVYTDDLQEQLLCYATSRDGIKWDKPVVNQTDQSNVIPNFTAANPPNVFKDVYEADPARRYKMLYGAGQKGKYTTNAAYSPNGIEWTREPANPVIPHSDTLNSCFWDARRRCYVAYVRYGPPNIRAVSRTESEDFVHWSPKVTVLGREKIDEPFDTKHYGMRVMSYANAYLGFISTYHGETIRPIPDDELWRDRTNVQVAFSRNGVTWQRVGQAGVISSRPNQGEDHDWKRIASQATFIPYGKSRETDWDWGQVYPFEAPLIVGDQIWFFYQGMKGRHWFKHHNDPLEGGFGLATLRLDGFVSVEAQEAGTLQTRRFIAIGDTLVVNADAGAGAIRVEAIDALGRVIPGFSRDECTPITGDKVRYVVSWQHGANCHPLQARPIKLKFYLTRAKLYSFEFQIRRKHYVPLSYSQ